MSPKNNLNKYMDCSKKKKKEEEEEEEEEDIWHL